MMDKTGWITWQKMIQDGQVVWDWTTCAKCEREYTVKKDGTIRKHKRFGRACPGSGRRPGMGQPKLVTHRGPR